jgi:hypothetical protein
MRCPSQAAAAAGPATSQPQAALPGTRRQQQQLLLRSATVTCAVQPGKERATMDFSASNFDLSLAVALAAAAFEAYLVPTGGQGFQERTINGSTVAYTDRWGMGARAAAVRPAGLMAQWPAVGAWWLAAASAPAGGTLDNRGCRQDGWDGLQRQAGGA